MLQGISKFDWNIKDPFNVVGSINVPGGEGGETVVGVGKVDLLQLIVAKIVNDKIPLSK